MIDASKLLKDLKRLLKTLETDVRARLDDNPEVGASLEQEWQDARTAGRTARALEDWLAEEITQAAVHWILGVVFLRFIEDNGLVERPWLSGPPERLALARDRYEAFFREHPTLSDREYLQSCFRDAETLPGVKALFDERHNPLWRLEISGDGAAALIQFCQRIDPDSGVLEHDFGGPDTRFLGDLYQDLSDAAKKRYALLQTPEFVERFILDRTLIPAIAEFGYRSVRLMDPACGSGHFLIDTFRRLFDIRARNEPNLPLPAAAQAALDQVAGVDINPFAAGIAHFRLLVAALEACGIKKLRAAPDFRINVATGDSLLHGRRFSQLDLKGDTYVDGDRAVRHVYATEDREDLSRILGRQYHVVVGNPPYITPKDPGLNLAYRERYSTCHMLYALSVPFIERFFDLALCGDTADGVAGYVGMIVSNSFMKREFGKKLIEEFFPKVDLTHVIDTAGAYIPGHGTPTTILFGRSRSPVTSTVRTVMGIKGEPSTPSEPANGQVWQAILQQVDQSGSESVFVSVADVPRVIFSKHPWAIGGGGATEAKQAIESSARIRLDTRVWTRIYTVYIGDRQVTRTSKVIGRITHTGCDEAYFFEEKFFRRRGFPIGKFVRLVEGEVVRDWNLSTSICALFPYDSNLQPDLGPASGPVHQHLFLYKQFLVRRREPGGTHEEIGFTWYEWSRFQRERYLLPLGIPFAFVATHNHFVLDRGGKVFNRSAPVIKLPPGTSEDGHFELLGLLNSSVACFWMKQIFHNKGSTVDEKGARQRTAAFEDFFEFTSKGLLSFPLVEPFPLDLARGLNGLSQALAKTLPTVLITDDIPSRSKLDTAREKVMSLRNAMVALQEELDWRCYRLYGLLDETVEHSSPPEIEFSQRAFEIWMARQMADGTLETTWFDRHKARPITELPAHWPGDYREIVERRLALIEHNKWINLIERPEFKRRWQWKPWQEQEQEALKLWLCDRLEDPRFWASPPTILSVYQLAERAREDVDFHAAGALYTGRTDFDVPRLIAELVEPEAVPFLAVYRYSADGLRKRTAWERVWDLQRREDAGEKIENIPAPPRFRSSDFQNSDFWRLRGPLDVSMERFTSYPGAARDADGSLPVIWAGYDHRQQAQALWQYYEDRKLNDGWPPERLITLLVGLNELLPWLKQWHNERDAATGARFGDFMAELIADEGRGFGLTPDQLRAWSPPAVNERGHRRKKKAAANTIAAEDLH